MHLTQIAKHTRDILHMDYLYVDQGRYLLAIADNLSQFIDLTLCTSASVEAASTSVVKFASKSV